jgi:hypothetical protein
MARCSASGHENLSGIEVSSYSDPLCQYRRLIAIGILYEAFRADLLALRIFMIVLTSTSFPFTNVLIQQET